MLVISQEAPVELFNNLLDDYSLEDISDDTKEDRY